MVAGAARRPKRLVGERQAAASEDLDATGKWGARYVAWQANVVKLRLSQASEAFPPLS